MENKLKAQGVRWDISDLYLSANDSRLDADLKAAIERAEKFAAA